MIVVIDFNPWLSPLQHCHTLDNLGKSGEGICNIYWYKMGLLKKFSLLINLSTVFWTWYIVYSVWITFIFYGICCIVNKAFKVMQTRVIEFSDAIFFMVTFLSKCRRIKIISEFSFNQIYPCNSERLVLRKRSGFYERRITSI